MMFFQRTIVKNGLNGAHTGCQFKHTQQERVLQYCRPKEKQTFQPGNAHFKVK